MLDFFYFVFLKSYLRAPTRENANESLPVYQAAFVGESSGFRMHPVRMWTKAGNAGRMHITYLLCRTENPACFDTLPFISLTAVDAVGAIIDRPISAVKIVGFRAVSDRPYIYYVILENANESLPVCRIILNVVNTNLLCYNINEPYEVK